MRWKCYITRSEVLFAFRSWKWPY